MPFRRLGTSLIYLVRPVVTGLLCPEITGLPKLTLLTAVMAVSRFPFAVPESHFGDEGQMACLVAGFTHLLLLVTSLSILEARSHLGE